MISKALTIGAMYYFVGSYAMPFYIMYELMDDKKKKAVVRGAQIAASVLSRFST